MLTTLNDSTRNNCCMCKVFLSAPGGAQGMLSQGCPGHPCLQPGLIRYRDWRRLLGCRDGSPQGAWEGGPDEALGKAA